jgi:enterochelin esterase-like enzyme
MKPRILLLPAMLLTLATACAHSPERLEYAEVDSAAVGREMAYAVWAPKDLGRDERLPLVVFLHGAADDESCFDEAGVGQYLDAQLAAGEIPRAVIVVPDGQLGFWENWYDGSRSYRDWVIEEVMPEVQARFHTLPCPGGCHVAGTSMGGHGAVRFALFEPDRFSSVSSLSGLILSTDEVIRISDRWFTRLFVPMNRIWGPISERERIEQYDPFLRWSSREDLGDLRLMVAWAEHDNDEIRRSNRSFHEHLVAHHVPHEQLVFEGRHAWVSWKPVIPRVLRFAVWGSMDAVPPGASGPSSDVAHRPTGSR